MKLGTFTFSVGTYFRTILVPSVTSVPAAMLWDQISPGSLPDLLAFSKMGTMFAFAHGNGFLLVIATS